MGLLTVTERTIRRVFPKLVRLFELIVAGFLILELLTVRVLLLRELPKDIRVPKLLPFFQVGWAALNAVLRGVIVRWLGLVLRVRLKVDLIALREAICLGGFALVDMGRDLVDRETAGALGLLLLTLGRCLTLGAAELLLACDAF